MSVEYFDYKEIYAAIATTVLYENAQTGTIINEILSNLNIWIKSNTPSYTNKDDYVKTIAYLIRELRSCHITGSDDTGRLIYLPLEEFKTELALLPEDQQKELKSLYDHMWYHNSIAGLINTGKINDHTAFKMLDIDNLATVAKIYVNNDWMKSNTLEWLLIDSMVFVETAEFASFTSNVPTQKFWNVLGYSLWQTIKFVFTEGVALLLTAFASSLVDSSQGTNFWIVFSAITIIRWLNPLKLEQLKAKAKNRILLSEMIGFYDTKFTTLDFNKRLVRELLYGLEKQGASYSPWIFHILDKRIASDV